MTGLHHRNISISIYCWLTPNFTMKAWHVALMSCDLTPHTGHESHVPSLNQRYCCRGTPVCKWWRTMPTARSLGKWWQALPGWWNESFGCCTESLTCWFIDTSWKDSVGWGKMTWHIQPQNLLGSSSIFTCFSAPEISDLIVSLHFQV